MSNITKYYKYINKNGYNPKYYNFDIINKKDISKELKIKYLDENLIKKFNNNVDFILDSGKIDGNVPSTIVRVVGNKVNILREGPISLNDIMEVIKNVR